MWDILLYIRRLRRLLKDPKIVDIGRGRAGDAVQEG